MGQFPQDRSIWDVGARAKQTSLFLKFIPSLASGQKWVINIICISNFSCKHAHTQDAVYHNSVVQTGFKVVLVSSLSSFLLVVFSQLFNSFRKKPWTLSWQTLRQMKRYHGSQRGSAGVLSAAFAVCPDTNTWGKLLSASRNGFIKIPSPSSHLFLFLHPLQRKEICNTADSSLSEEFHGSSDSSSLKL